MNASLAIEQNASFHQAWRLAAIALVIVGTWSLSQGQLTPQGAVTFKAYVDAGIPEAPSEVVRAPLSNVRRASIAATLKEMAPRSP